MSLRKNVWSAMDTLNKFTCVKLTNATDWRTYSIMVVSRLPQCSAAVGYKNSPPGF